MLVSIDERDKFRRAAADGFAITATAIKGIASAAMSSIFISNNMIFPLIIILYCIKKNRVVECYRDTI